MLIVIEGLDAAGKNTQAKALAARFNENNRLAVVMSFHRYETPIGGMIKDVLTDKLRFARTAEYVDARPGVKEGKTLVPDALAEAYVIQALATVDKYDAVPDIEAHIRTGRTVICDRWTPSALCYGTADGLSHAWLYRIQEKLPVADFSFFIDVSEEEALRRRPTLRDRYERDREKQRQVRENYVSLWAKNARPDHDSGRFYANAGGFWIPIDGAGTISEVTNRIWSHIVGEERRR